MTKLTSFMKLAAVTPVVIGGLMFGLAQGAQAADDSGTKAFFGYGPGTMNNQPDPYATPAAPAPAAVPDSQAAPVPVRQSIRRHVAHVARPSRSIEAQRVEPRVHARGTMHAMHRRIDENPRS